MTKNEIKTFLKDNNITENDIDDMWDYCASFPEFGGELVKKLKKQGLSWRDLNVLAATSLLGLYEKIEKQVLNTMLNINKDE